MSVKPAGTRWYNAVWRWHFYAGMLCVPFVIWLACTGTIYLWKPQIERALERRYDSLAAEGARASGEAQVVAAVAALPGAKFLRYELPASETAAARVIVSAGGEETRVFVDPHRPRVLGSIAESRRPMEVVSKLHGQLLAGKLGSWLVEIAACWALVMLLTGLYLWWPRGSGLAGVLYPRLRAGGRRFWRDLHAVAGVWVSVFAMFLIVSGLPWANAWGSWFKEVRSVTGTLEQRQDWAIAGVAQRPAAAADEHAEHRGMRMASATSAGELDRAIATIAPLGIAPPVMIAAPAGSGDAWVVTSDAANRPLRTRLTVDGASGKILMRKDFGQRHWIDRAVGYGIAIHEGAYFGLLNQLLGTATALLLVLLAVSGAVMWWRRRPIGLLGAPIPLSRPRFGALLVGAIMLLGLLMPLFGATLLLVLATERLILRRLPGTSRWLGCAKAPLDAPPHPL